MIWSKDDDRRAGRGYHHGNLKEALVRAALELITKNGPAGFTFAEAARTAGVSPAAPYRHFRDRDELMADVALRGFNHFETMLARAWNEGSPDPSTAFENIGRAYLEFARNESAFYSAMFEAAIPLERNPELRQASERAFTVLRLASDTLIRTLPSPSRPPALMMALHIWALLHGLASLFGRGDAARRPVPMAVGGEFIITLRLASGTNRGTAKRSDRGRHGRAAVRQTPRGDAGKGQIPAFSTVSIF